MNWKQINPTDAPSKIFDNEDNTIRVFLHQSGNVTVIKTTTKKVHVDKEKEDFIIQ